MELPITLDRENTISLQVQIYEQVRRLILARGLDRGYSLPASRVLAGDLGVSRNTVLYAYERLINEGYLETRGTAGTFVTSNLPEALLARGAAPVAAAPPPIRKGALAPLRFRGRASTPYDDEAGNPQIDMRPERQWRHLFPAKEWRRLAQARLAAEASHIADYGDPAGHPQLRQALAKYLGPARGIVASANQILVTNGSLESLNIVARLFVAEGTPVAIENPCYANAAFVFESYGARLRPVNIEDDGMDLDGLAASQFNLVYTTPAHQFPVGTTMSVEQRQRLLDLAWAKNAYIIEDDYDGDFRYDGPPLRSLCAADANGCVIYLGSFTHTLGAGLRLGFMVLPIELVEPAITIKSLLNCGNSWLDQVALADMLDSGAYVRHLRRARSLYLARRNNLTRALKTAFDDVHLFGASGGAHLLWLLPPQFPDAATMQSLARARGVGIYTTSSGGAHDFGGNAYSERGVVFGFAPVSEKQIWEAVSRIAMGIDDY